MALQTQVYTLKNTYFYNETFFDDIINHTRDFNFDIDDAKLKAFGTADNYVGFVQARPYFGNITKVKNSVTEKTKAMDGSTVIPSTSAIVSEAWDEDFLTIFAVNDTGFPGAAGKAAAALFISRGKNVSGESGNVVGYWKCETSDKLNDYCYTGKLITLDTLCDQPGDYPVTAFPVDVSTPHIMLLPASGRGGVIPDKVQLIGSTPDDSISTVGWVRINGREYFKNGIFLIDAQR